ncbi:MAG: phosphate ABC transporter permease subunit PstC [Candidatus Bathyarchaeota archaeon]|nr:phosphate ABC transporter permease subunit PstC [Candidatus Bathyarchaeota archaeon]
MSSKIKGDTVFKGLTAVGAASAFVILIATAGVLLAGSTDALGRFGLDFLVGTKWVEGGVNQVFGVLPYILGTLVTSGIALLIGVPLSLGIAIFLVEFSPKTLRVPLAYLVELLAAVPSVIYGLWGIFVLRFWIRDLIEVPLHNSLGWIPIFSGTPFGLDVLTGGVILAIMIIPTIASVSREVISAVPNSIREGGYSIGATKWEVIKKWVLSYGRSGIFGAIILGLGRAVGETMAVTMVIGNTIGPAAIPTSLFKPSQTLASLIANNFLETVTGSMQQSAYMGAGLVLLLISVVINIAAYLMVTKVLKVKGGAVE